MIQLKLGKMTSKEIAAWMGLTYNTYRNNIDKYLKRLTDYALFDKIHGGIIVKEIYISVYDKNIIKQHDLLFLKEVQNSHDSLATITGLTRKIQQEKETNLSSRSINRQLTKSRDKLFGESSSDNIMQGIAGSRKYVWAIKLNDYNKYRLMTLEEKDLFDKLITDTYKVITPSQIKDQALLNEAFRAGEISQEDYFASQEKQGLNFFDQVIFKFKEKTGLMIVRANQYEIGLSFNLSNEDQEYRNQLFKEAHITSL